MAPAGSGFIGPGTVSVFLVPAALLTWCGIAGEPSIVAAAEAAFVRADLAHRVTGSRALSELTQLWGGFHLLKAAIAGVVVLSLAALSSHVRCRGEAAGPRGRRRAVATAYGAVILWQLGALTLLLANVQGALAPFASATSLLPTRGGESALVGVLDSLRQSVAADPLATAGGIASELLADFALYHAVFAVMAAVAGLSLSALALRAFVGRWPLREPARSHQGGWLLRTTLHGASGSLFLLLSLANFSTWMTPVPALLASLGNR